MSTHERPGSGVVESVLDLPQLYQKPSFEALCNALQQLRLKPHSWDVDSSHGDLLSEKVPSARYLMSIVSSPLSWLTEDQQEIIWDMASKRIAERSGTKAMPAMTRLWSIPKPGTTDHVSISLHEPGLTEDNLGLKTWGSSYVLSSNLGTFDAHLGAIVGKENLNVLELGSGTGLVGLAAAMTWNCKVLLTDLPAIVPNLAKNIVLNEELFAEKNRLPRTSVLDWINPPEPTEIDGPFDIVLAADPLYDVQHAPLLAVNVDRFLRLDSEGRVLIMHPLRDEFTKTMGESLQQELSKYGFTLLACGIKTGFDDWESTNGQPVEVHCWWGVWKRSDPK